MVYRRELWNLGFGFAWEVILMLNRLYGVVGSGCTDRLSGT